MLTLICCDRVASLAADTSLSVCGLGHAPLTDPPTSSEFDGVSRNLRKISAVVFPQINFFPINKCEIIICVDYFI